MRYERLQVKSHFVDGVVCGDFGGGKGAVVHADAVDVGGDAAIRANPEACVGYGSIWNELLCCIRQPFAVSSDCVAADDKGMGCLCNVSATAAVTGE